MTLDVQATEENEQYEVLYYCRGHVDKAEFAREVHSRYQTIHDPVIPTAHIAHGLLRERLVPGTRHDTELSVARRRTKTAFEATFTWER